MATQEQWLAEQAGKLLGMKSIWKLDASGTPTAKLMDKLLSIYGQANTKFGGGGVAYSFSDIVQKIESNLSPVEGKGFGDMVTSTGNITTGIQKEVMRRAVNVADTIGDAKPTKTRIATGMKKLASNFAKVKDEAVRGVQAGEAGRRASSDMYRGAAGATTKMGLEPTAPHVSSKLSGPVSPTQALVRRVPKVTGGPTTGPASVADDVAAGGKGIIGKLGRFFRGGTDKLKVVGEGMEKKAAMSGAVGTGIGMAGLALTIADFMARNQEANMQVEQLQLEGKKLSEMAGTQIPTSMYHEAMLPQLQQQTQMGHQAIMSKLMGGGAGSQLADGEMQI